MSAGIFVVPTLKICNRLSKSAKKVSKSAKSFVTADFHFVVCTILHTFVVKRHEDRLLLLEGQYQIKTFTKLYKYKTMMKKKIQIWVMAATLVCGAVVGVVACDKANAQVDNPAPAVVSTELIRTSQS